MPPLRHGKEGNAAQASVGPPNCLYDKLHLADHAMEAGTHSDRRLKTIDLKVRARRTARPEIPSDHDARKYAHLKAVVAVALILGFALSRRLWVSARLFPLSPVADLLPAIPFPLDYVLLLAMCGLLVAVIAMKRPRTLIVIFLALSGMLVLWDQNRLQPWFYLYWFMLTAISSVDIKKPIPKTGWQAVPLNTCRLMLVATYFWSGLQKLNANFVKQTWPDMAGPLLRLLPQPARNLPAWVILIVPLIEIVIAVGLLARRSRNAAVVGAVGMHVFILALLVSSGENSTVWPWNVAMIILVLMLFWRQSATPGSKILWAGNHVHALILLLFGILPALSFLNLWDSYLSAALYSGNTCQAAILMSPETIPQLPPALHPYIWQNTPPYFLDINRWSYGELNVPVYPEPRVYKRATQRICELAGNSSDLKLLIKGRPNLLTGVRQSEYFDCDHLGDL